MARSDGDSWEITESVGATALGVASARDAETRSENPLISDPYASCFLAAAGDGVWSMYRFDGEPPGALLEAEPRLLERIAAMRSYVACRTKFFDDFFRDAGEAGISQAVILAAGLDARAWRLDWPADAVLFELDLPKVLAFKADTLDAQGASARVRYVPVAVDLRDDWPTALESAGFDPSQPASWIAEGLLPYLPPAAQDLLFERIDVLSVPGSRIAVENFGEGSFDPETLARQRERGQAFRRAAEKLQGQDIPDVADLWYLEDRTDAGEFLAGRGWRTTSETTLALLERHGRRIPADLPDATPHSAFLSAEKTA
ncbi:S-adenosyl-L-methionine-dependent methyltransferase [Mycobacteroides abscessus subsp. bolletii]|uniref:class I SAM-dependent methyltransferase n=1 Tax=Mycobacteroides abscessus TaxID=36809 RepID=UPI0009269A10|nr:class I SAM-dependent methyltransferase [Mycobacteroides abscessus]SHX45056.1 S-adenosyl-L-methionine-dependent methyltransferase [Mycobacteroides abscessus subsp. bolletii]SKP67879.1 S-adenosyl-L-methionine-dependent methyltransferase [Mycobacteroides abscessus subsp. bolletii]SKP69443.1 S-adenosyl-L-methionine-dependent methyltransferase [Mycobacteroides abscessus subsp. bolletii]SKQ27869.1 S-adenosyl-L-methionine-dependent methyltransferase [Mycobacteroides abscessus subsp. bolletii]